MIKDQKNSSKRIMELSTGFLSAKVALVAAKLDLFTFLGKGAQSELEIRNHYGFHGRGLSAFLDSLVALGLLNRLEQEGEQLYQNSLDADSFLNRDKPTYLGEVLCYLDEVMYKDWTHLEEGLRTGQPLLQLGGPNKGILEYLYVHPKRMKSFFKGLEHIRREAFQQLCQKVDFSSYNSFCDVGGGTALLSTLLAQHEANISCINFDLASVENLVEERIEDLKLEEQVEHVSGDLFEDKLPPAEVYCLSYMLYEQGLSRKRYILEKIYEALPQKGLLIVVGDMLDHKGKDNLYGLLRSLDTLLHSTEGEGYASTDLIRWADKVGFQETEIMSLTETASAALLYK